MLNSKALTKIQSALLILIIAVAVIGGAATYSLWKPSSQQTENIKIGFSGDLDMGGQQAWQGAILAAEQINAEGGVLGRNFTIVAQDTDDDTSGDTAIMSNALTRLITVDKADFIITSTMGVGNTLAFQDICAEHKKIVLSVRAPLDNLTLRVSDNYDRYKYYFRVGGLNSTAMSALIIDYTLAIANLTGFTKIAALFLAGPTSQSIFNALNSTLPKHGLEIVYLTQFPVSVTDFTSYFAAIEASGAQILIPGITTQAAIPFVKEWYDRQSPVIVCGLLGMAQDGHFMELTEGKCDTVSFSGLPVLSGYPLTTKVLPTSQAYTDRWGETPTGPAVSTYDIVRFILPDAIKRAGTTETEAVIKALETTNIETSMARHFTFTASHDVMIGFGPNGPDTDHVVYGVFQWQNGNQVIIYPDELREEAKVTYRYPLWEGPWTR